LWQPFGFRRIETAGAVFDRVAAVGQDGLAWAQGRAGEQLRRESLDGIAVDTGDLRGLGQRHPASLGDSGEARYRAEIANRPLAIWRRKGRSAKPSLPAMLQPSTAIMQGEPG